MWRLLGEQHPGILEPGRNKEVAVLLLYLTGLTFCTSKELFSFNYQCCSQIVHGKRKRDLLSKSCICTYEFCYQSLRYNSVNVTHSISACLSLSISLLTGYSAPCGFFLFAVSLVLGATAQREWLLSHKY